MAGSIATLVGIAIKFAIQTDTFAAQWAEIGSYTALGILIASVDYQLAKNYKLRDDKLREAVKLRTAIQGNKDAEFYLMPTDIDAYCEAHANENYAPYNMLKDPINLAIDGVVLTTSAISIVFSSAVGGVDDKIVNYIHSYLSPRAESHEGQSANIKSGGVPTGQ